jgi:hypothetical protein
VQLGLHKCFVESDPVSVYGEKTGLNVRSGDTEELAVGGIKKGSVFKGVFAPWIAAGKDFNLKIWVLNVRARDF